MPIVLIALLAAGTPAPRFKPAPPISVVGRWKMSWGESAWEATFSQDGHYASWGNNVTWIGTWKVVGSKLYVTERPLDSSPDSVGYSWVATISQWRGCIDGKVEPPGPSVTFQLKESQ